MSPKRIVVIGPESTGKSTLCNDLAQHYHTIWVREYARQFLLENGTAYTVEDLFTIGLGQLKNEQEAEKLLSTLQPTPPVLLFDTDLYVIKVWSEYVFDRCDNRILSVIADRKYDGYLLCNTDLPWVKDELREYPDLQTRERLFNHYKDLLVNQHCPWAIVSGIGEARIHSAVIAVDKMLTSNA
jgi:NadR type nicotinamide-nucleotide adenylyltransferase